MAERKSRGKTLKALATTEMLFHLLTILFLIPMALVLVLVLVILLISDTIVEKPLDWMYRYVLWFKEKRVPTLKGEKPDDSEDIYRD